MANKAISKRKFEPSQSSAQKKIRLCTLHDDIIRPVSYKNNDQHVPALARYISRERKGPVEVISWGTLETVKALIEDGLLWYDESRWKHIPDEFKDAVIDEAIVSNGWVYKHMSEERKRRKGLLLLAIYYIGEGATHLTDYIPDIFKSDIDVVISLLEKYAADRPDLDLSILPSPYEWCDKDLFSQPVVVMQAIRHDYGIMDHLCHYHSEMYEKVSDNKQFVLQFIDIYRRQFGGDRDGENPLQYVSSRLCNDPDVLNMAAAGVDGSLYWDTLNFASQRLCEDPDFVIGILQELPEDVDDPGYIHEILENNCPFLACDIDFIIRVVNDVNADAILWFDEWFRNNFDAVKKISKANPLVLEHVSASTLHMMSRINPNSCPSAAKPQSRILNNTQTEDPNEALPQSKMLKIHAQMDGRITPERIALALEIFNAAGFEEGVYQQPEQIDMAKEWILENVDKIESIFPKYVLGNVMTSLCTDHSRRSLIGFIRRLAQFLEGNVLTKRIQYQKNGHNTCKYCYMVVV